MRQGRCIPATLPGYWTILLIILLEIEYLALHTYASSRVREKKKEVATVPVLGLDDVCTLPYLIIIRVRSAFFSPTSNRNGRNVRTGYNTEVKGAS